jgi:MFS family permease
VSGWPGLLAHRDFRLWYLSRSASVAGTAASAVALPLLVYQSSGSPTLTAAVVGLEALPYLLLGLLAGAAADRLPRKAMMICADLGCALLLATVPVASVLGVLTAWHVLAVAFGVGCGFCLFDSAAWGAQLRLVGRGRIAAANSTIWSTQVVLEIGSPAVAGLLAAATDPAIVLAADALSYLLSAALIAAVRASLDAAPDPTMAAPRPRRRLRAEIGEGLAYLWHEPTIRTLSLTGFGFNVACGGVLSLMVVYADQILDLTPPDRRIGLLYTAAACGTLIATVVLPRLGRHTGEGRVSVIGYALFVIALIGLALNTAFATALPLWTVWACSQLLVNGNGITVRQLLTPDELQARVNTTGRMIAWGGTPFGALLGGLLAETAGAQLAYLVLTAPAAIGLAVLLASPIRHLRLTTAAAQAPCHRP